MNYTTSLLRAGRPRSGIIRHSSFVLRGIAAAFIADAVCSATASADTIDASAFAAHFDAMFPGYAGAAPLTDFPVLVRLSPALNKFDYSLCQSGGADLRFADADGNLIPCEIDTWNENGESLVWVKVPSLSRATKITAYYGCANPPANTPSAVWSNGFVGVWHLGGTSLPLIESSGVSTASPALCRGSPTSPRLTIQPISPAPPTAASGGIRRAASSVSGTTSTGWATSATRSRRTAFHGSSRTSASFPARTASSQATSLTAGVSRQTTRHQTPTPIGNCTSHSPMFPRHGRRRAR